MADMVGNPPRSGRLYIMATAIAAAVAIVFLVWAWLREEKAQGVKSWRPDAFT